MPEPESPIPNPRYRPFSLEGKLAAALALAIVVATALTAALTRWFDAAWLAAAIAALVLVLPAIVGARALARPVGHLIRVLAGSVAAFRDGDYSASIVNRRNDEVGDLVAAHNELGALLREQRQNLFQRELLLDTVVQNTPNALVLIEPGGHVVYANLAARGLLNGGRALAGESFERVLADSPPALAQAYASGVDGLFGVRLDHDEETFHLSQRAFKLQGRPHRLVMIRRMTRELSRQEVATWKKVIRVISHELNNSLAPIRSLSHSGRQLVARGDLARLALVFETIEERARHLEGFVLGYARFAKLPQPAPEAVEWAPFVEALARQHRFARVGTLPERPGWFDRAQLEQALINLLKNAHEAGGDEGAIELEVGLRGSALDLRVRDRGGGMSESVLENALLPFYSTKRSGSGLGLALVREIAEAHGGRVQLANRDGGGLEVALILPQPAA